MNNGGGEDYVCVCWRPRDFVLSKLIRFDSGLTVFQSLSLIRYPRMQGSN